MVIRRVLGPIAVVVAAAAAGFTLFNDTGRVGSTRLNGFGCLCHGGLPADSVILTINGPSSLPIGGKGSYRISVTGGPAVAAGFNLAAGIGALGVADPATQLLVGELTHTTPKFFENDSVSWEFTYTAPLSPGSDTIYSVANSVDYSLDPTGDAWNFGPDFIVSVHADTSTTVAGETPQAGYALLSNYPNPFNPSTTLSFALDVPGRAVLTVYDVRGREVAALLDEELQPGDHLFRWDASGFAAGVYYGRLHISNPSKALESHDNGVRRAWPARIETRAMLLIR